MTEYELVDLIKDMVSLFVVFGAVIGSLCVSVLRRLGNFLRL